jgi:uncharacterized protein YndB with AHSA1/START domain
MTSAEVRSITITRVFNAPIARVWTTWTTPEQMKQWWGPANFTAPVINIDFRVGGTYLYCMHGAPGPDMPAQDFWSGGTYLEIVPMQKIVASDHFADAKGNVVSPKDFGMPGDWPAEMIVTTTFEDLGNGQTKLILHHTGHPIEMEEMASMGWNQSLDKFATALV